MTQSALELVERITGLRVPNWQQETAASCQLKLLNQDALDIGLPRSYCLELDQQKHETVFAHIEEATPYPER